GQAGIRVALTYRSNAAAAEETAQAIRAAGGQATTVEADLEQADALTRTVDGLVAEHGPLQTVVHAVGSAIPMRYVSQIDVATWQRVLHADVDGFFHLVRACLPHLRKARGSLVALTSAGLRRFPVRDVLSVAPKAAIEALLQAIAREEGRYGV